MARQATETNNLTTEIITFLTECGHLAWRNNSMGVYDPLKGVYRKTNTMAGTPDIICILQGGQFLGIEIKTGKDSMSRAQTTFMNHSRKLGALYWIVFNTTDFINKYKEYEKLAKGKLPVSDICKTESA